MKAGFVRIPTSTLASHVYAFASHLLRSEGTAALLVRSIGVQSIMLLLSVGTGILTARLLGPEGRGVFAALTTWPGLLGGLATSGVWSALVILVRRAETTALKQDIVSNAFLFGFVVCTALIALGATLLPRSLAAYPPSVVGMAQVCLLGTYGVAFQAIYRQSFAGLGDYQHYNLLSVSPQFFYLLAVLGLAFGAGLTAATAAVSLFATAFVALALQTPALLRKMRIRIDRVSLRQMPTFVSYVSRAAGHDLVAAMAGSLDRLFLIPLVSPDQLGFYAAAFSLSRLLMVIQPAIGSVFLSSMSQRGPAEMKALHDMAFRVALYGLALATPALMLLASPLITLAYGPSFARANGLFDLLLIEAVVQCLIAISTQLYLSCNRPGLVSIIYVASFGVLALSLAVLVPRYGAPGAAMAAIAGSCSRLLMLGAGMRLHLGMALPRLYLNWPDLVYLWSRLGV